MPLIRRVYPNVATAKTTIARITPTPKKIAVARGNGSWFMWFQLIDN